MAKNNEYLESFKIEMVRKYMTSESKKDICQKYGISKSTFWGWKCKYGDLISKELATDAKPERRGNFVDIVATSQRRGEQAQDPLRGDSGSHYGGEGVYATLLRGVPP